MKIKGYWTRYLIKTSVFHLMPQQMRLQKLLVWNLRMFKIHTQRSFRSLWCENVGFPQFDNYSQIIKHCQGLKLSGSSCSLHPFLLSLSGDYHPLCRSGMNNSEKRVATDCCKISNISRAKRILAAGFFLKWVSSVYRKVSLWNWTRNSLNNFPHSFSR